MSCDSIANDNGSQDLEDIDQVTQDDINKFREMKDTVADTLNYTFFLFETIMTVFLLGFITQHYYYVHTIKAVILLLVRWNMLKQIDCHYFYFDHCNWVNILILFYLWSPWKPSGMFPAIFLFAHGPLIYSVYACRNGFVPHSVEKMTALFVHVSPAMVTWSIRWYSTPEQGFQLCANPTEPGVNGCNDVRWYNVVFDAIPFYLIWVTFYTLIVLIWRDKFIKEKHYATTYNTMKQTQKWIYPLTKMAGPKYRKFMFMTLQATFTILASILGYMCYHSLVYNYLYFMAFVMVACYNGATFYTKVVGKKYYQEKDK